MEVKYIKDMPNSTGEIVRCKTLYIKADRWYFTINLFKQKHWFCPWGSISKSGFTIVTPLFQMWLFANH